MFIYTAQTHLEANALFGAWALGDGTGRYGLELLSGNQKLGPGSYGVVHLCSTDSALNPALRVQAWGARTGQYGLEILYAVRAQLYARARSSSKIDRLKVFWKKREIRKLEKEHLGGKRVD